MNPSEYREALERISVLAQYIVEHPTEEVPGGVQELGRSCITLAAEVVRLSEREPVCLEHQQQVRDLELKLAIAEERIDASLYEQVATQSRYKARIAELEASVGHLTTANLRLQEVNDKLRTKVAVLTTRLDKSQDRLQDAELALSMAEQRVAELEARLDASQRSVEAALRITGTYREVVDAARLYVNTVDSPESMHFKADYDAELYALDYLRQTIARTALEGDSTQRFPTTDTGTETHG